MAAEHSEKGPSLVTKYDIGLEKLEPKYIQTCSNIKELEKILRILRSGEEGYYPHVEKICEERIEKLNPKSRILRKEERLIDTSHLSTDAKENIFDDLQNWTNEMKSLDARLSGHGDGDSNLPPVRGAQRVVASDRTNHQPNDNKQTKKNPLPKSYKEWDKIIHNMDEQEEEDTTPKPEPVTTKKNKALSNHVNCAGLSEAEKEILANREKDKGNEAFRSGDFAEAITYYNRSLGVVPIPATFNNRALAYIRVSKWSEAVSDCNTVLKTEPGNVKAKLRRAVAYKSLRKHKLARQDLDFVLKVEPQNKRAKDMIAELDKEEEKSKGSHRMVIEETDGESSDEEEIICNKPIDALIHNGHLETEPATVSGSPTQQSPESSEQPQKRRITIEETESDSEEATPAADGQSTSSGDSSDSLRTTETRRRSTGRASSIYSIIQQSIDKDTAKQDSPSQDMTSSDLVTAADSADNESTQPQDNVSVDTVPETSEKPVTNPPESKESPLIESAAPEGNSNIEKASGEQAPEETNATETAASSSTEPVVIEVPRIPVKTNTLKTKGNDLFKTGQYGDAVSYYTQAINTVEKDECMAYHTAILYSNRAACYLKTGECTSAISDCTTALSLSPHNTKALLRRASAYEMKEKYMDAYVDYRHVINVDSTAEIAFEGATRCRGYLNNNMGASWRTKVPKIPSCTNLPKYVILGTTPVQQPVKMAETTLESISAPSARPLSTPEPHPFSSPEPSPIKEEVVIESNEDKFNRLKDQGNKCVGKGLYQEAIPYYGEAIDLYTDRVAPYSNRALCYLKTNQPLLAIKDCDVVLAIEPGHIKALFRRAQGFRIVEKYKESLGDLMTLLKKDANNAAAKKEVEEIKVLYRKQLESLKQPAAKPPTAKAATRVQIEEVSDSDNEKTTTNPAASVSKSAKNRQKKKAAKAKKAASVSVANARQHPVPSLSATPTAYEFTSAWTSLKQTKDLSVYAQLLRQVPPSRIATVLSNKLEADMLETIILCLNENFTLDELNKVEEYLKNIATVPRFSMITMFMSAKCKSGLESLLTKLQSSSAQVDKLKLAYGL